MSSCQTNPTSSNARKLAETVDNLSKAAMAPSTYKAYARSWELFREFAFTIGLENSQSHIPLSTNRVALFVAFLYERGLAVSSIKCHLLAIAYSHRMLGVQSPSERFLTGKLIKGVAADSSDNEARYPITLPILNFLLQVMQNRGAHPGPLFCQVDGSPISRFKFTTQLQHCLQVLNHPIKHYKSHSFRIGAATHGKMRLKYRLWGSGPPMHLAKANIFVLLP